MPNNFMQAGSLTIGGNNVNYGGNFYSSGNWSGNNTAGLLMECLNNTEIAVHDAGHRIASLMYYEGGTTNTITIGRDMGWGTTNIQCRGSLFAPAIVSSGSVDFGQNYLVGASFRSRLISYFENDVIITGYVSAKFQTVPNSNRDLLGIRIENSHNVNGGINNAYIYCIQDTFTGFHRVFTNDILFDSNDPQLFKDNYEGRIVISTGKIATDTNDTEKEWVIKYDKDGITIEDALPQIELSRKKKDKRVFGVLGDKKRSNSRPERMIVNSVGEGALYVINSNGNIENGDYITSSDYLGYGEKQDEIFLCNYTVAKATINCEFILDSPYYNCFEIDDLDNNGNKLRIAFIAVTYHCG